MRFEVIVAAVGDALPGGGTLVYVAERSGNRVSLVDMANKSRTTVASSSTERYGQLCDSDVIFRSLSSFHSGARLLHAVARTITSQHVILMCHPSGD